VNIQICFPYNLKFKSSLDKRTDKSIQFFLSFRFTWFLEQLNISQIRSI